MNPYLANNSKDSVH